jgi:hypothetical protein
VRSLEVKMVKELHHIVYRELLENILPYARGERVKYGASLGEGEGAEKLHSFFGVIGNVVCCVFK